MTPQPQINWDAPPDPQEIEQLRDAAAWPLSEKLVWLEQTQRLAESLQAAYARRQTQSAHYLPND